MLYKTEKILHKIKYYKFLKFNCKVSPYLPKKANYHIKKKQNKKLKKLNLQKKAYPLNQALFLLGTLNYSKEK